MLAPRDAATDDETSEIESVSGTSRTSGAENEKRKEPASTGASLTAHAVTVGDSPLASEDDSPAAKSPREQPPPPDNTVEENTASGEATGSTVVKEEEKRGSQPYDVPIVGDFYMHDDRSPADTKALPRKFPTSRRDDGINASRWKHDKFEELERQFSGPPIRVQHPLSTPNQNEALQRRGARGRDIPTHRGRWMKNPRSSSPGDRQELETGFQNRSVQERGRGRGMRRGYRGRGRGYSGRFGPGRSGRPYEQRS